MTKDRRRVGFVISPIGAEGSLTRRRSDQVFHDVIEPALVDCSYMPLRADKITKPGVITEQILSLIWSSDIVVADLTDHNPNVFYELGVRSAARRPVISLMQKNQVLPFDVQNNRTIFLDFGDNDSLAMARTAIVRQIAAVEGEVSLFNSSATLSRSELPQYIKAIETEARGRSRDESGSGTTEGFNARIYSSSDLPGIPLGVVFIECPASNNMTYIFLHPGTLRLTFGRGPSFRGLIGTEDQMMSMYHFVLEINRIEEAEDGSRRFEFAVKDIGSKHGTFVNGRRVIEKIKLRHADVIEAGISKFTVFCFF